MIRLPVIFRIGRNKDAIVTAVFPTLPAGPAGSADLTVYEHVGQHGSASLEWYRSRKHRPATPAEYAALLNELRGIYGKRWHEGDHLYELVPCRRISPKHRRVFRQWQGVWP